MRLVICILLALLSLEGSAQLSSQEFLIPYRKGNLWGYTNAYSKVRIQPAFDSACFFDLSSYDDDRSEGAAMVVKNGNTAWISREGKMLLHHGGPATNEAIEKEAKTNDAPPEEQAAI